MLSARRLSSQLRGLGTMNEEEVPTVEGSADIEQDVYGKSGKGSEGYGSKGSKGSEGYGSSKGSKGGDSPGLVEVSDWCIL